MSDLGSALAQSAATTVVGLILMIMGGSFACGVITCLLVQILFKHLSIHLGWM